MRTYHHLRVADNIEVDFVRWDDTSRVTVTGPFAGVVQADEGDRFSVEVRGCLVTGPKSNQSLLQDEGAKLVVPLSKQSGTQYGTSLSGGRFRIRG